MRPRERAQRRTGMGIDERRWRIVGRLGPDEERLGNVPALFPDSRGEHVGGFFFLTSEQLIVAFVEPFPWSGENPAVRRLRLADVGQLTMDDGGYLAAVVTEPSQRPRTLRTYLVPNDFSSELISELRRRWEAVHGRVASGTDRAWAQWRRRPYPVGPWAHAVEEHRRTS